MIGGANGFERVVVIDWSSASRPGPPRPAANQVWSAVAAHGRLEAPPLYHRTRGQCAGWLTSMLKSCSGRVLVGFDFAMGYPADVRGSRVLPGGRPLGALLGRCIEDDVDTNQNNRFEAARDLNGAIEQRLGVRPFWGCTHSGGAVPRKRPRAWDVVNEFRGCERWARAERRSRPQSAWKLAYAGSVGGQALVGMAIVDRLLTDPALRDRARVWPFETAWADDLGVADGVVFAEVYPSLVKPQPGVHRIRDAAQVMTLAAALSRDTLTHLAAPPALDLEAAQRAAGFEGWIAGLHSLPSSADQDCSLAST